MICSTHSSTVNKNHVLGANSEGKEYFGHLSIGDRIILNLILKKRDMQVWIAYIWIRTESSGGLL